MSRYSSRSIRLHVIGVLTIVVTAALVLRAGNLSAKDNRPEEGYQAPDFALKRLDGKMSRLSDFLGKVVLVNFWATWCPPCRMEMPAMQKMYADYKAKGFEILAVDIGPDTAEDIHDFTKDLRLTFPVLLDPDMKVARQYRIIGLPVSMLVDRHGIIRLRETGYTDWTDREARKIVEKLLH